MNNSGIPQYIVEFEKNNKEKFWLAPWDGDPGRTLDRKSAKQFTSVGSAEKEMKKVIAENPHRVLKGHVTEF